MKTTYTYERADFGDRGLGWYYYPSVDSSCMEYPEEGKRGPFHLLGEAMEDAHRPKREPPLFPTCKKCGLSMMRDTDVQLGCGGCMEDR
jgi:hypothetical protein